jgi:GNAT superfamily N-acetyltransferase
MIREITESDLKGLLQLYTQLHGNPIPESSDTLSRPWEQILLDKNHHIIVAEADGRIVSSCVLVVVPNLTHQQRPYALLENLITDEEYRGQGLATACLNYAKEIALLADCYKIMLLTGSKQESTFRFYENAGFNKNDKTAFIQWFNP